MQTGASLLIAIVIGVLLGMGAMAIVSIEGRDNEVSCDEV